MAELLNNGLEQARIFWASDSRRRTILFRSPLEIWGENPSFLILEATFFMWTALSLKHALRCGGRYIQLWLAAFLHGVVTELLSYSIPDVDNFWHYQGTVMLYNRRLPLYIMFLYPCFYYTAYVAVSRLRLGLLLEPFAMAIGDLILDIPYDLLGVRMLWWTWHDTDPNLFERTYYVPWTSYMFHLTFTSTFLLILNASRVLLTLGGGGGDMERGAPGGCCSGFVGVVLAGCLTMPLAVLGQLLPLYNLPHDGYGIHTEVLLWILLGTYVLVVWIGGRNPSGTETRSGSVETASSRRLRNTEVSLSLVLYYLFLLAVLVGVQPESVASTGLHQTVGNCSAVTHITTVLGHKLPKYQFLCASDYDEPFSLLCGANSPHPASFGASFYTICGTAFPNLAEFRCITLGACLLGVVFYFHLLSKFGLKTQKQKKS